MIRESRDQGLASSFRLLATGSVLPVPCSLVASSQMRRGFSIFLILLFAVGPLSAAIDGSEDANLPLCCRRHGVHHCAMTALTATRMDAAEPGSTPEASAPLTCPNYPGLSAMIVAPAPALTASPASLPAIEARTITPVAGDVTAFSSPSRTHAGRGPPESRLS
jgi:hypothetical protein